MMSLKIDVRRESLDAVRMLLNLFPHLTFLLKVIKLLPLKFFPLCHTIIDFEYDIDEFLV